MNFVAKPSNALRRNVRFLGRVFLFPAIIGIAAFATIAGYREIYRGRIFSGVSVRHISVAGLTESEARARLTETVNRAMADGVTFRIEGETFPLPNANKSIIYKTDQAVSDAMLIGRCGPMFVQWMETIGLRANKKNVPLPVAVDHGAIETFLHDYLSSRTVEPKDATISITIPTSKTKPLISITPERIGRAFDIPSAMATVRSSAAQLAFPTILIPETAQEPEILAGAAEESIADLPRWLSHLPLRLMAEGQTWTITSSTFVTWLTPIRDERGFSLSLSAPLVRETLLPLVEPLLKPSKNGSLTVKDGRAETFVAPVEGIALDTTGTVQHIVEGFAAGSTTIPLALVHEQPLIAGDAERMGIRESLGVGRSSFFGSPPNRRKNIALGAQKVNGSLIAPNEEFSLLQTLGKVNGANGWLPELVIKGNKTTPEFGGGLCQIGTTTFRMTLAGGMPITERRNHSYRVRYYEPAGTDATIYEPSPDFRFKNDTEHWLLITTEMRKDHLAFTLWGMQDGRKAVQVGPKIFNIVPPPKKKIIETLELEPGKTKCTEVAHAGADAQLDYRITYADGTLKKTTFSSHYRPWGAVCLLGVKELSPSSTSAVDESGTNNPN